MAAFDRCPCRVEPTFLDVLDHGGHIDPERTELLGGGQVHAVRALGFGDRCLR